jgi:hypothetical protein
LRRLEIKKLIIVSQNDNKKGKRYRFNLKFKTWEPFVKKSAPKAVSQNDNNRYHFDQQKEGNSLVKILPTKEKIKKRNKNPPSNFSFFEDGLFENIYTPSKAEFVQLKQKIRRVSVNTNL